MWGVLQDAEKTFLPVYRIPSLRLKYFAATIKFILLCIQMILLIRTKEVACKVNGRGM